jgi:hypothetical protein
MVFEGAEADFPFAVTVNETMYEPAISGVKVTILLSVVLRAQSDPPGFVSDQS